MRPDPGGWWNRGVVSSVMWASAGDAPVLGRVIRTHAESPSLPHWRASALERHVQGGPGEREPFVPSARLSECPPRVARYRAWKSSAPPRPGRGRHRLTGSSGRIQQIRAQGFDPQQTRLALDRLGDSEAIVAETLEEVQVAVAREPTGATVASRPYSTGGCGVPSARTPTRLRPDRFASYKARSAMT
jgi:hypothetical protein